MCFFSVYNFSEEHCVKIMAARRLTGKWLSAFRTFNQNKWTVQSTTLTRKLKSQTFVYAHFLVSPKAGYTITNTIIFLYSLIFRFSDRHVACINEVMPVRVTMLTRYPQQNLPHCVNIADHKATTKPSCEKKCYIGSGNSVNRASLFMGQLYCSEQ
jgi:hypothetical protein